MALRSLKQRAGLAALVAMTHRGRVGRPGVGG